jgi:Domain of unknown function (DUF4389)
VTDQPVFEAQYVERHSRLTTFFRYFLAIPHFIVLAVWGFAAFFAVLIAWFAIVFTGRYPEGLYKFVYGLTRYAASVSGYFYLLTDEYPPFSSDVERYPVQIRLSPEPKAEYNRLKTLLRIVLIIPPYIIAYALGIVAQIGAFLAWIVIVVTGKQPRGLQDMIVLGLSYQQRVVPYYTLMTEDWPAFVGPESGALGGPSSGSGLPAAPATAPAPAAPEAPTGAPRGGLSGGDPLGG